MIGTELGHYRVDALLGEGAMARVYRAQHLKLQRSCALKVLTPEQLFDSLEVALALPISSIDRGPRYNGLRDAMVSRMEEAIGNRPDDFRGGIPQVLAWTVPMLGFRDDTQASQVAASTDPSTKHLAGRTRWNMGNTTDRQDRPVYRMASDGWTAR